jgi:hypothetical protein
LTWFSTGFIRTKRLCAKAVTTWRADPMNAPIQYSTRIFAAAMKMPVESPSGERLSRRCNAVVKLRVFKDLGIGCCGTSNATRTSAGFRQAGKLIESPAFLSFFQLIRPLLQGNTFVHGAVR